MKRRGPGLIAMGFIGAFALSVVTVIYTGLNVRGHGAAFDGGFRSVTMAIGETRTINLVFESTVAFPEAMLDVALPDMIEFAGSSPIRQPQTPVSVEPGSNTFTIEIKATAAGKDYLRTSIDDDIEAIDIYRVFVTVEDGES
jgi:hypothetical protein